MPKTSRPIASGSGVVLGSAPSGTRTYQRSGATARNSSPSAGEVRLQARDQRVGFLARDLQDRRIVQPQVVVVDAQVHGSARSHVPRSLSRRRPGFRPQATTRRTAPVRQSRRATPARACAPRARLAHPIGARKPFLERGQRGRREARGVHRGRGGDPGPASRAAWENNYPMLERQHVRFCTSSDGVAPRLCHGRARPARW